MNMQDQTLEEIDNLFEETLSPEEFPNISKVAEVQVTMSAGFNKTSLDVQPIKVCILSDWEDKELMSHSLPQTDKRFFIRCHEMTAPLTNAPTNTKLLWGGVLHNVVRCTNIAGLVYDIQAQGL